MNIRIFFFGILILGIFATCREDVYDATSFIEMKKDPCFGFCPVYSVRIDGSGAAWFSGDRNVEKTGSWQRQLSREETVGLFKAFEKSGFWNFEEEYTAQVSDLPTVWLTFNHQGLTKTVKDYYGAPAELKALEALIEELAETRQGWEPAGADAM